MTPGEAYEVTVEAFPTSNLFAVGHRMWMTAEHPSHAILPIVPAA